MVWPAIIGGLIAGGAGIAGGMAGQQAQAKAARLARQERERAAAQIAGTTLPEFVTGLPEIPQYYEPGALEFQRPDYSGVGAYAPLLEETYQAGPTAMEQISLDPNVRAAQMDALAQMQGLSQGGMTPQDQFQLMQIQQKQGQAARGARGALEQEMAQRGVSGGGLEFALKAQADQAAAEQAMMGGLGVQANAQQRAMEALAQSGQLAGQLRSQGYGEQSDLAKARDYLSQFNLGQRADVQRQNIAAQNAAAQRQQDLARGDIREAAGISRDEQLANLDRQRYINELRANTFGQKSGQVNQANQIQQAIQQSQLAKAVPMSNILIGQAGAAEAAGQQQAQNYQNMAGGVAKGAETFAKYYSPKKDDEDKTNA